MMAQHSAGPWFVAAQNDGLVIIDGAPSPAPYDGPIPKAHGPNVVATPNWRLAEHEANARLIAAAPELLEALCLYRAACGNTAASVDRELVQMAWAKAVDAIAKATGAAS